MDLSEDSRFFIDLLDGTHAWRERVVEELTFASGTHVRVEAAFQIDFPPALLARHVPLAHTKSVKALIPLTTREKQPLLNLDVTGPAGRPAHMITRASTSALEAQYVAALARTSDAREALVPLVDTGIVDAICYFSPDRWREVLKNFSTRSEAVQAYIRGGSRAELAPTMADVGRWSRKAREAGLILKAYGDGVWHEDSSSHDILLALPHLDPAPSTAAEVDKLLDTFLDGVQRAHEAGDALTLNVLSEYGHRYEIIVETELVILEPNTIRVGEDRPLGLDRLGWTRQQFSVSDARSAHFEARVRDPNVTFSKFGVDDPLGASIGLGGLESARRTRETLSLYTSDEDRPVRALVSMKLRLARHLLSTALLLSVLNLVAGIAVALVPGDSDLLDRLAVLAVPTTIAAAFALTREQTALASRLMKPWRAVLLLTTAALWMAVLVRIAAYDGPAS